MSIRSRKVSPGSDVMTTTVGSKQVGIIKRTPGESRWNKNQLVNHDKLLLQFELFFRKTESTGFPYENTRKICNRSLMDTFLCCAPICSTFYYNKRRIFYSLWCDSDGYAHHDAASTSPDKKSQQVRWAERQTHCHVGRRKTSPLW